MHDWLLITGLIVCAILVLIPVVMIGTIIYSIGSAWLQHRREEARRVTIAVPGLGELSSTDDRFWFGEVGEIQVSVETTNGSSPAGSAERTLGILETLRPLADAARRFLGEHEDVSWLTGGSDAFEVESLEVRPDDSFALEFSHPVDPDGIYWVEFREGTPLSSGRDD